MTRVARTGTRSGLQPWVKRCRATWGLGEGGGGTQRSHSEQTVDQEEAEVELDLVLWGTGLHGEVAIGPHGHKVVLLGFLVGVDDHAIVPDCLATEVHHVH